MTKKHFEAIATDIRMEKDFADTPEALTALHRTAVRLGITFGEFNSHFDYNRFVDACGF